jgi:uncharacterized protein (DUF433 family)
MTTTATAHIQLDEVGVAWIDSTRVKVLEVVRDHQARGWSPEEIHFQHPHLSLAQVHAALSYYYDNRDEIDRQLQARRGFVEEQRSQQGETPVHARLRAAGKLS